MATNSIAVNIGSYGKFRDGAFAHLESIGIRYVEIPVPTPDQLDTVRRRLRDHGLETLTLNCPCDLTQDAAALRERFEVGREMGIRTFFISGKTGDLPKPEAYVRLRERVEMAADYGITLSLETHQPLGENATEARATLHAVDHPNLRWNLDTANLYYYNKNIDAVEQTQRGIDLIHTVHLKDTNGGYGAWFFPPLGGGVVDFPAVFGLMNQRGFYGPFSMELEGIQGRERDEAAVRAEVAQSLAYLKRIGVA